MIRQLRKIIELFTGVKTVQFLFVVKFVRFISEIISLKSGETVSAECSRRLLCSAHTPCLHDATETDGTQRH